MGAKQGPSLAFNTFINIIGTPAVLWNTFLSSAQFSDVNFARGKLRYLLVSFLNFKQS